MWQDRRFLDLVGIDHPIVQAPMAGSTTPKLVAAVSNAGGLGSFGAAAVSARQLGETVSRIRELSDRNFNVNLFFATPQDQQQQYDPESKLAQRLTAYNAEMGLGPLPKPSAAFPPVEDLLPVLIEQRVAVISFHFGVDAATVAAAQAGGAKVLCSATTVAEAVSLEQAGVDAIIAQGAEAGGHRGTFAVDYRRAMIGTLALVPQIVDAVSVPVIAAGGIMDGRGLVASLALGAAAVQMGTAFLGCPEASVAPVWRERLLAAGPEQTAVTEMFSGRPARSIRNRFVDETEALNEQPLPFPSQFSVCRALRQAAAEQGEADFMALWAGQGVGMYRQEPAGEFVAMLVEEAQQISRRISVSES